MSTILGSSRLKTKLSPVGEFKLARFARLARRASLGNPHVVGFDQSPLAGGMLEQPGTVVSLFEDVLFRPQGAVLLADLLAGTSSTESAAGDVGEGGGSAPGDGAPGDGAPGDGGPGDSGDAGSGGDAGTAGDST